VEARAIERAGRRASPLITRAALRIGGALGLALLIAAALGLALHADTSPSVVSAVAAMPPSLLLAGGSLQSSATEGLVASRLPDGRQVGQVDIGGPSQGDALAAAPNGRHAYLVDATWLTDQQRKEWRLTELELPSLRVLHRAAILDGIDLLGEARIAAVAHDGAEVYVETMRIVGPQRFDPQLRVGQPDSEYGIAVYDVPQRAFTRTIRLDPPWCGVGELDALPDGRLAVLCPVSHQLRLVDPRVGRTVGRVPVTGDFGASSVDGQRQWIVSRAGQLQEMDLTRGAVVRTVDVSGPGGCGGCVPWQRPTVSADGRRLFVRAAPGRLYLVGTLFGTVVWVIDTASLQRVAELPLPAAAIDQAPTPDGAAVLASTGTTDASGEQATWLLSVPDGQVLARWPQGLCCLHLVPSPAAAADARGAAR